MPHGIVSSRLHAKGCRKGLMMSMHRQPLLSKLMTLAVALIVLQTLMSLGSRYGR